MRHREVSFDTLKGAIINTLVIENDKREIAIRTNDGRTFKMLHEQECCEDVYLEDVCGDIADVIGSEIIVADALSNHDDADCYYGDSHTWTYYTLGTAKGCVTFRWHGSSNGYYSEAVNIYETCNEGERNV